MAIRWISLVDLMHFPKTRDLVKQGDKEKLYSLLYELGFDVNGFGVSEQVCWHRPLVNMSEGNNEPVYTLRYLSEERNDIEWLKSGNASREKIRESQFLNDPELIRDLEAMEQQPNFTKQLIDYLEDHWGFMGVRGQE